MSGKVLLFDGFNSNASYIDGLDTKLGREVKLVKSIPEAIYNVFYTPRHEQYTFLIAEPEVFLNVNKIFEYKRFLEDVRSNTKTSVIIYSTQEELAINNRFGFEKITHYNEYVGRSDSSQEELKKTLDKIVSDRIKLLRM